MKTIVSIILLLISINVQAQTVAHNTITNSVAELTNSYEVLVSDEDHLTVLQLNNYYTKELVFNKVNQFVNSYSDIDYYYYWNNNEEYSYMFISTIIISDGAYRFIYGDNAKRLIIEDLNANL